MPFTERRKLENLKEFNVSERMTTITVMQCQLETCFGQWFVGSHFTLIEKSNTLRLAYCMIRREYDVVSVNSAFSLSITFFPLPNNEDLPKRYFT